ncbi:MAG: glutamate-5-semialdehyde dehydrogenase [Chloroflexi bacterium]|jgi:glutamate-5-semialdehyde dehydrogenase|uniref:Gamma-glutamyl phosphate reductase n=1 Tax=Candidatus Thermofonsia Clade 3 bacterium TaxID=2364212 RepID=A0A2M8QB58_9CHLR|nr:glutamate-5-semialdehyde dehydrogenase [Candidatus Roseilinea sp. NK_OTU-006]PJF47025.1 MAG: glutamate-5-semialdehyde dehydrogenase [Candidatus Thermofonsia Clade 3 bacterium]RMG65632.1 MAG: glutamate-5-semialdehyde dehydrogenase [Chloroflexota bacterium]
MEIIEIGRRAKAASKQLARAGTTQKNAALLAIAEGLMTCQDDILRANAQDVANAKARNVETYFIDRLTLTPQRLQAMANDVRAVAALPDPVGEQFDHRTLPNGLRLHKRRVPLGVLGVIYEARPNVTTDVAALALKSGNAVILRGGSDNIHSNAALTAVIHATLDRVGLPADAVQLIADTDRARILELLRLNDYVDLIIPRGGEGLHRFCREHSTIPVITGGMGINHLYVDETADQAKAVEVVFNAKTSKPTVCNALGTLLVQATIAAEFLPKVAARLVEKGVELRCDERAFAILRPQFPFARRADDATDWDTEWLALILGVKVVDSLDEAIAFIRAHTMEHSDGICSRDPQAIERFLNEIDSSAVFVNASTRFNDGGQFGLGAEVAISTQRIHARGPMGLRELTSYKWVCEGDGHVRL